MQVFSISSQPKIYFSSSEPLVYDDEISQKRRNFIRFHYNSWHNKYQDIYEKEHRLEEYELNKLVKFYSAKPKKIDASNLKLACRKIDKSPQTSIYRGQSLMYCSDNELKKVKDAGFLQVIDFAGFGDAYKKRIEKAGMSFFEINMETFWNGAIFNDCSSKDDKRKFIDKFVNYINKMQVGNAYIGCDYGSYRTDDAVMLNSFFNPLANRHPVVMRHGFMKDKMKILYNNLSNSDKLKIKWTNEFEVKFASMIKRAMVEPFHMF